MKDITYRPYCEQDASQVKTMLNDAFHIHRYAGGYGPLLDSALEVYLRQVLVASTFSAVAVIEDRVVGIVTGRVAGEGPLPGWLLNRLRLWGHYAKIALTGWSQLRTLRQYFQFSGAYAGLRSDAVAGGETLTDELTVFVVDSSTRGTGVGKALFERFGAHLRRAGRHNFYLYTDTLCTYQFYEKRGMARSAERTVTLDLPTLPSSVGVYLYTGDVLTQQS
jgi:predicted N-acetyltransferase YhbS